MGLNNKLSLKQVRIPAILFEEKLKTAEKRDKIQKESKTTKINLSRRFVGRSHLDH